MSETAHLRIIDVSVDPPWAFAVTDDGRKAYIQGRLVRIHGMNEDHVVDAAGFTARVVDNDRDESGDVPYLVQAPIVWDHVPFDDDDEERADIRFALEAALIDLRRVDKALDSLVHRLRDDDGG